MHLLKRCRIIALQKEEATPHHLAQRAVKLQHRRRRTDIALDQLIEVEPFQTSDKGLSREPSEGAAKLWSDLTATASSGHHTTCNLLITPSGYKQGASARSKQCHRGLWRLMSLPAIGGQGRSSLQVAPPWGFDGPSEGYHLEDDPPHHRR